MDHNLRYDADQAQQDYSDCVKGYLYQLDRVLGHIKESVSAGIYPVPLRMGYALHPNTLAALTDKGFVVELDSHENYLISWVNHLELESSTKVVDASGFTRWINTSGKLHRVDGPAFEADLGYKEWRVDGKLHRVDGPARDYGNGTTEWYLEDQLHRVDGPAITYTNGSTEWFLNGERHRVGGPARESTDGSTEWFLNGERHRVGGPALEWPNGHKQWWENGTFLRSIGPL
jgi:hypothetical protein